MNRTRPVNDSYETAVVVKTKPTAEMTPGVYRVVDENGIYWGTYRVARNWCGDRFVMDWNY